MRWEGGKEGPDSAQLRARVIAKGPRTRARAPRQSGRVSPPSCSTPSLLPISSSCHASAPPSWAAGSSSEFELGSSRSRPSLPDTEGSTRVRWNPALPPPLGLGYRPRASRRNAQECAAAPRRCRRRPLPGHVAWLPVHTTPRARDLANRLPGSVLAAARSPVLQASAGQLEAHRPARPSASRSPGSSLARPPGRGLPARPPLAASAFPPLSGSPPHEHHGFFFSAQRQGLPLRLSRRWPSSAAPAARCRRKSRGTSWGAGAREWAGRVGAPPAAPRAPRDPTPRPPRSATGARRPATHFSHRPRPGMLGGGGHSPGRRGGPAAPVVRGAPQVLRGVFGRGPGRRRPRTLGAPCAAAADAIVCPAPCLSPRRGAMGDGVRPRGEASEAAGQRTAGPEPAPWPSPWCLIPASRNCGAL